MTGIAGFIKALMTIPAEVIDPPKSHGADFHQAVVNLHHAAMQHSAGVPEIAIYVNDGAAMRDIIQELNARFTANWPPEISRYSDLRPMVEEMSNGTTRSARLCGVTVFWPEGAHWQAMPGMVRERQS